MCLGNELEYNSDRMVDYVPECMLPLIQRVLETRAWLQWEPAEPDAYFLACTGFSYRQLYTVIDTLLTDHGLPPDLR